MCRDNETCNRDGSTPDGIVPFTKPGDLTTPNPVYFRRVDNVLKIAAAHGMVVLLTPVETSGWLETLRANGEGNAFAFGQYLGRRYQDFPNIVWMHGNDFQTWQDPADDTVVLAVARGIKSVDKNHIHTIELNYLNSASLDDARWEDLVQLNGVYSYYPTYAKMLDEYNRGNFKPVFLQEANYEFERNGNTDGGSLPNLRRQEYWTMLSGGTGQLYGSHVTWTLPADWKLMLDTPGISQLHYMKTFFEQHRWQDLIPDQKHAIVVAGYGSPAPVGRGSITTDTYATTAATSDNRLAIAYLPSLREIRVDLSRFPGAVQARWFDPTVGTYRNIGGARFANAGISKFVPPGRNHDGDEDWVLVLEAD
jgi:hypothetical protein